MAFCFCFVCGEFIFAINFHLWGGFFDCGKRSNGPMYRCDARRPIEPKRQKKLHTSLPSILLYHFTFFITFYPTFYFSLRFYFTRLFYLMGHNYRELSSHVSNKFVPIYWKFSCYIIFCCLLDATVVLALNTVYCSFYENVIEYLFYCRAIKFRAR